MLGHSYFGLVGTGCVLSLVVASCGLDRNESDGQCGAAGDVAGRCPAQGGSSGKSGGNGGGAGNAGATGVSGRGGGGTAGGGAGTPSMSGNSGSDTAGEGGNPDAGGSGGSSGDDGGGGDDAGATGEGGRSQAGAAGEENGGAGDRAGNSAGGTGGTGGSAGTGGSGGSDTSDCVEITLTDFYPSNEGWPEQSGETAGFFSLGALTLSGSVSIEYRLGDGRGRGTGVITLGDGGQDDYATCSHCVVAASSGRVYIATSGTLFLDNDSDQGHGYPQGALLNVTLREATIDGVSRETALVPQGTCLYLESQKVDIDPVGTWTECPPEYQEDEDCDCGCGAFDSACASAADSACDYCFCPRDYGDCANSPVNAGNNAVCSSG